MIAAFPPVRFGDDFNMVGPIEAAAAVMTSLKLGGEHKGVKRAYRMIYIALSKGALVAFIHWEGTAEYYRVPPTHWRLKPMGLMLPRLAPRVIYPVDGVPENLVGGALFFDGNRLADWLQRKSNEAGANETDKAALPVSSIAPPISAAELAKWFAEFSVTHDTSRMDIDRKILLAARARFPDRAVSRPRIRALFPPGRKRGPKGLRSDLTAQ